MKTTIKIFSIVAIILFITYNCYDTTTNKTSVGEFWCYGQYCKDIEPTAKDAEASISKLVSYQNSFIYGDKQIVTIYKMVPNDPSSYYKGFAEMRNDTLYLDIKEERRLSSYFNNESYLCASVFKFYFTSNKIPNVIYLWGHPLDSLKNQVNS
jgi:hypothetical protein